MELPRLDLQQLDLAAMDRACREWGSFVLLGHDIDEQMQQQALTQCQTFFRQPSTIKNRIRRSANNAWGYFDAELTKNRRDWKEIIDIGPAVSTGPLAGSSPQWPGLPGFRDTMEQLSDAMHRLALTMVRSIAAALQCSTDLTVPFARHSSFLRLNYYPACPEPAPPDADFAPKHGHLGISHHTDAGAVTVLLQDAQPGLQIHREGAWHTVDPVPGGLVINTGDIVQVWSNDRYPAALHRVLANAACERISLPYFLNPDYDYDYAPLDEGLPGASPPRSRAINWGEFRSRRRAGDYADYGEEVQISQYAVADPDG
jgi:isopenicillin N synthase-like dioxygenase